MQPLEQQLRSFIVDNFLFGEERELGNDASFLDNGIIDSTGVLELVLYLETTFGFTVEDNEVIPENLDTVNRLVGYVTRKLSDWSAAEESIAAREAAGLGRSA